MERGIVVGQLELLSNDFLPCHDLVFGRECGLAVLKDIPQAQHQVINHGYIHDQENEAFLGTVRIEFEFLLTLLNPFVFELLRFVVLSVAFRIFIFVVVFEREVESYGILIITGEEVGYCLTNRTYNGHLKINLC